MRNNRFMILIIAVGLSLGSCTKNSTQVAAPTMNQFYFLPAYVTDQTAPNAKNNTVITTAMPDAIYYSTGIPATGVIFTFTDQTNTVLTTLTGVPQGTVFNPGQYYIVNLPSSFTIPVSWLGKVVTITASNSTAFTKYRIN